MNHIIKIFACFAIILLATDAFAQNKLSVIRDHETEEFLKEISKPIFDSIGLDAGSVEIIIINDKNINAFVSGGQKIFIHTGLIAESDDVSGLIGVIAHEAGHIKGAHTIQKQQSYENVNFGTIAGYVLGLGSVFAGAPPEAGIAISSASQNIAVRNALSYSREYENTADSIALEVLKDIKVTPRGLVGILNKLLMKQKLSADVNDKYLLTHPVSEDRINHIKNYMKDNPSVDVAPDADISYKFNRVKAKVYGFLYPPEKTRTVYNGRDEFDTYANSVAYHNEARFDKSEAEVNKLLAKHPKDPYYNELLAQFLFEQGKIDESIVKYNEVLRLLGNSSLVRLKLANAYLTKNDNASMQKAISQLKTITILEPSNINAIHQLGIAYGKMGHYDESYLYLAESAILAKNRKDGQFYLAKAKKMIDKTSDNYKKLIFLEKKFKKLKTK